MLLTIEMAPGIVRDQSAGKAKGRWIDGNLVRFVDGMPQSWGGWERMILDTTNGVCRSVLPWKDASSVRYAALGSHDMLEVANSGQLYDITPASGFTAGQVDGLSGPGFGVGGYGDGPYGESASVSQDLFPMRWSLAKWGQNLLASPRRQGLFEWAGNTAAAATAVAGAPDDIGYMFVTPSRFVMTLATKEEVSGTWNPMLARWCDQELNTGWTTTVTGEAGEIELTVGNILLAGTWLTDEGLIWSDEALYAIRETFDELIWSMPLLGEGCGIVGPDAWVSTGGAAYWMSRGAFFVYDGGAPKPIPCELDGEVFKNISPAQHEKIIAAWEPQFREVKWFYPDARDGNENSRYVALNIDTGKWSNGLLARTAWSGANTYEYPIGVAPDGNIYFHEIGVSADGAVMGSSIESGLIGAKDGNYMLYLNECMPDFEEQQGSLDLTIYTRETTRGAETTHGPFRIGKTAERVWFEALGRFVRFKIEGVSTPEAWRLGAIRFAFNPTSMRE